MKAAELISQNGGQAIAVEEVDKPDPGPGKVLVEVHEAGVNPLDWKITKQGNPMTPKNLPITLGGDFAGVVRKVGSGVTGIEPGDEVYGMAGIFNGGSGSFAEYDVADAGSIALKPGRATEQQAAGLPLTGMMALQALTEIMQLSRGQKLLIQGGAGGIGSIAIQLARHLGAEVIVTCAADQADYVRELGADQAIDYQTEKFEDVISGCDAVYDLVGGEVYSRSYAVLRPGGIIVSTLMPPDKDLMSRYKVNAVAQHFEVTTRRLDQLAELVDEGVITVHVEKSFPLERAAEALKYQEDVHPRGKVVIDVK